MKLRCVCLSIAVGSTLLAASSMVQARLAYLGAWQNQYPTSTSDDIQCQLCHQNTNGGSPWNAYGWELREIVLGNDASTIEEAFVLTESLVLDNNPLGAEVYDEIISNFQPGWSDGAVNSVFYPDGEAEIETPNQQPAPLPMSGTTAYDFPPKLEDPIPQDIPVGAIDIGLVEVASGFNAPVRAVSAPGINGSIFVVEQTGRIYRVELATGQKTLFHTVQADLVAINQNGDERGLLGLAFHPNYQNNGLFYTYQSEPVDQSENADFTVSMPTGREILHRSKVVEYRASDTSCNSAIRKTRTVMSIDQPQNNHNGGDIAFGPDDYLYVSLGDGGNRNDLGPGHGVLGNGRDNTTILGSILRIEPLGNNASNGQYGVPADNPFVANGNTGIDEIFAYGFRNPYRISFDAGTGELYTGDVGQYEIEEINKVVKGGNYGWNWKEGSFFFYTPTIGIDAYVSTVTSPNSPNDLVDPIGQYDHDEGISVIGGYVYRGSEITELAGQYVFGDFLKPLLYLNPSNSQISKFQLVDPLSGYITGFGQDNENELYVVTNNLTSPAGTNGKLLRLVDPSVGHTFPSADQETSVCPADPDFCVPIITKTQAVSLVCL